jgi:26S proteasome regulatory subunit N12
MEGNYRQLADLKNSTDKYYNYYLGKFDNAIRFQIARSAEKSYDSLKINDAVNLLMLKNADELNNFVKEQNEGDFENREIDWKISNDRILFIPLNKEKESIPAHDIIRDTFILGNEVEKII